MMVYNFLGNLTSGYFALDFLKGIMEFGTPFFFHPEVFWKDLQGSSYNPGVS
jgi:hypothetical protein